MRINDWELKAFKLFQDRLTQLEIEVTQLAIKDKAGYRTHKKTKLLKSVFDEIVKDVPSDPTDRKFLLGRTLGSNYAHWRRVKKGLPARYRLFFQFMSSQSEIVYAWLNDEMTLRKDGSKTDVYTVFSRMLKRGEVPDSYAALSSESGSLTLQEEERA